MTYYNTAHIDPNKITDGGKNLCKKECADHNLRLCGNPEYYGHSGRNNSSLYNLRCPCGGGIVVPFFGLFSTEPTQKDADDKCQQACNIQRLTWTKTWNVTANGYNGKKVLNCECAPSGCIQ